MNMQDIREMFKYNYWANYLLLDTAEKITQEKFTATSSHSFGSLQATLVHTLDTEMGWRILLQNNGSSAILVPQDFPTVTALCTRWQQDERDMWAYLDTLTDEDLSKIMRYEGDAGVQRERVLWHCLFHVVNHGMQHRAEAAHLLTSYGQSPGEIDFTIYLNEIKTKG